MASNKHTPTLTPKHAVLIIEEPTDDYSGIRIRYETYRQPWNRTNKQHNWVVPKGYEDVFNELVKSNPEVFDALLQGNVDLKAWSEQVPVANYKRHVWWKVEFADPLNRFYTDPLESEKITNHRNDNLL